MKASRQKRSGSCSPWMNMDQATQKGKKVPKDLHIYYQNMVFLVMIHQHINATNKLCVCCVCVFFWCCLEPKVVMMYEEW